MTTDYDPIAEQYKALQAAALATPYRVLYVDGANR